MRNQNAAVRSNKGRSAVISAVMAIGITGVVPALAVAQPATTQGVESDAPEVVVGPDSASVTENDLRIPGATAMEPAKKVEGFDLDIAASSILPATSGGSDDSLVSLLDTATDDLIFEDTKAVEQVEDFLQEVDQAEDGDGEISSLVVDQSSIGLYEPSGAAPTKSAEEQNATPAAIGNGAYTANEPLVVTEPEAHAVGKSLRSALVEANHRGGHQTISVASGLVVKVSEPVLGEVLANLDSLELTTSPQDPAEIRLEKNGSSSSIKLGSDAHPVDLELTNLRFDGAGGIFSFVLIPEAKAVARNLSIKHIEAFDIWGANSIDVSGLEVENMLNLRLMDDQNVDSKEDSVITLRGVNMVNSGVQLLQGGKGSKVSLEDFEISGTGTSKNYLTLQSGGDVKISNLRVPETSDATSGLEIQVVEYYELEFTNSEILSGQFDTVFASQMKWGEAHASSMLVKDVVLDNVTGMLPPFIASSIYPIDSYTFCNSSITNSTVPELLNFTQGANSWRVKDSVFEGNTLTGGGGIYSTQSIGTASLEGTVITDNQMRSDAAALVFAGTLSDFPGTAQIETSTLTSTEGSAIKFDRALAGNASPGIAIGDEPLVVDVANSTLEIGVGEKVDPSAIELLSKAEGISLALDHVTISGGGINIAEDSVDAVLTVNSTVVDTESDAVVAPAATSIEGFSNMAPKPAQLPGATAASSEEIALSSMSNSGPNSYVLMPSWDSKLIDAASETVLSLDQRGKARVSGSASDIGAVEVQLAKVSLQGRQAVTEGESAQLVVKLESGADVDYPNDGMIGVAAVEQTAVSGIDFAFEAQTVTAQELATGHKLTVQTFARDGIQGSRDFEVQLTEAQGLVLAEDKTAMVRINDTEVLPVEKPAQEPIEEPTEGTSDNESVTVDEPIAGGSENPSTYVPSVDVAGVDINAHETGALAETGVSSEVALLVGVGLFVLIGGAALTVLRGRMGK